MLVWPLCQAYVTELVRTPASHVVAALSSFNEHFAGRTSLPIFEFFLEIFVASSVVPHHLAFFAILSSTSVALILYLCFVYHSWTIFSWAKFKVGVVDSLFPHKISIKLGLRVSRQMLKHITILLKDCWTTFLWTANILHHSNFVDGVSEETRRAKEVSAVWDTFHFRPAMILLT